MEPLDVRHVSSAAVISQCPAPELPEFAFLGRSNVGKSSLINMLAGIKGLAKISSTPGKTRLINHFLVEGRWYLVDLPGYGYARASKESRAKWNKMVTGYLSDRTNLMCSFILIDLRHEMLPGDAEMIRWFGEKHLPFGLIFTKSDKLSRGQKTAKIEKYRAELMKEWEELPPHWVTSSVTSEGRDEILQYIHDVNGIFARN